MTGILLTGALLILLVVVLIALLCYEHAICGWLYRRLGRRRWLQVIGDPCAKALAEAEDHDPYPAGAADAPDPLDEHFSTAPRVVAGQDLDDSILVAEWQDAYAKYRAGVDIFAGAIHEPSPEVKQ